MNSPSHSLRLPRRAPTGMLRACIFVSLCGLLSLTSACTPSEKIVRYKPFLTGIDGAQFGGQQPVNANEGYLDPTAATEEKTVIENPDGTKTLISKSPRTVMAHLERFLDEGDDRTLLTQVISEKTLTEMHSLNNTDEQILNFLKDNRRNIAKTFARMPLAEHTPTVIVEQPGDKTWVLRLTGAAAKDLRFTALWVRYENGSWRFLWIT